MEGTRRAEGLTYIKSFKLASKMSTKLSFRSLLEYTENSGVARVMKLGGGAELAKAQDC